jgi:micrococcal nuclease
MRIRIVHSLLVAALALGGCAPARADMSAAGPDPEACEIARIVDGDTFHCADGRKVRLIGIDSPELRQGTAGRDAREALRRLLPEGGTIRLEGDAASRDRWGRTLAYAWSGGRLINEAMVRGGWAMLYTVPPNVKYVRRLERAQNEARARSAGLWAAGGFDCPPGDFRRRVCATRP